MKPKDIFKEFRTLGYDGPGIKPVGITDTQLVNYTILRTSTTGYRVLCLLNGTSIRIPWMWMDLFLCFNTWGGHRLRGGNINKAGLDNIDKTILCSLDLVNRLVRKQGEFFMNTLSELCTYGTKDFRVWYRKEFGDILEPLEFNSLENFKEI